MAFSQSSAKPRIKPHSHVYSASYLLCPQIPLFFFLFLLFFSFSFHSSVTLNTEEDRKRESKLTQKAKRKGEDGAWNLNNLGFSFLSGQNEKAESPSSSSQLGIVMAGSAALASEPNAEVFSWLKSLPLAPEYRPTLAEFQDPISYIFKIEKEASKYGICKIVPPVPPSSKKTAIANLNRSLAARAASSDSSSSKSQPTFTTRQQQIGFCPRKQRPVQRPVWQSGEYYTFQEFEAKARAFEKNYLKKYAKKGGLSPLEIETLYWKATVDKPFSVEYANDMPGSAFVSVSGRKCREAGEGVTLGETAWNMRGVSRANGSLLRFMKEEIPGVTSPMVYVAMLFSWFAWHVEDHDLHSLNYLHMGAGKTWYGVPRDAAVAFEEVVRVHGYGGEINPLGE